MVSSSAGDMQTQATSCVFVALLYMGGQLPGEMEEFTEWWRSLALKNATSDVCSAGGSVLLPRLSANVAAHAASSAVDRGMLERAEAGGPRNV